MEAPAFLRAYVPPGLGSAHADPPAPPARPGPLPRSPPRHPLRAHLAPACPPVCSWARATLEEHARDPRAVVLPYSALDRGATGDAFWDAAQQQLAKTGKS